MSQKTLNRALLKWRGCAEKHVGLFCQFFFQLYGLYSFLIYIIQTNKHSSTISFFPSEQVKICILSHVIRGHWILVVLIKSKLNSADETVMTVSYTDLWGSWLEMLHFSNKD